MAPWSARGREEVKSMFPKDLTSTLTGVTRNQLERWAREGFLTPSGGRHPEYLYTYQDLVALRFIASLRSDLSLQKIKKVESALNERGKSLRTHAADLVQTHDGYVGVSERDFVELLTGRPGQHAIALKELYKPFRNFKGDEVVDFERPADRLEVREGRLGGWPTIAGSRLAYDLVANLAPTDDDMRVVLDFYPTLTEDDVRSARAFDTRVRAGLGVAA